MALAMTRPNMAGRFVRAALQSTATTSSSSSRPRLFSSFRAESEEKHHLARALSRSNVDDAQQKKWARLARGWKPPSWKAEQSKFSGYIEDMPPAKYESEALRDIHERSFGAQVLLEIRDVRLPASTHHPSFTRLGKHRLHLICYTHADMIDADTRDRVEQWTNRSFPDSRSIFVDTRANRGDADCFDAVYDGLLHYLDTKGGGNSALTVGVANTGKSSLLLALLRNAKAREFIPKKNKIGRTVSKKRGKTKRQVSKAKTPIAVEDVPGKTREITEYLIREKPKAFFLDVPGVTPPSFFFTTHPEAWFGFGATNCLPVHKHMKNDPDLHVGFCNYVLHCLNRDENFQYVNKLRLEAPTNDIQEVLSKMANKYANKMDEDKLLLKRCANFLKLLNTGNLGPVVLDDLSVPYKPFVFRDEHFQKSRARENRRDADWDDERPSQRSRGRENRRGADWDERPSQKSRAREGRNSDWGERSSQRNRGREDRNSDWDERSSQKKRWK